MRRCLRLWRERQNRVSASSMSRPFTSTAYAFATARRRDGARFAAMAKDAKLHLGEFNPQHLANNAWASAQVEHWDEALFGALAKAAPPSLGELNARELVNSAWAFGEAKHGQNGPSNAKFEKRNPNLNPVQKILYTRAYKSFLNNKWTLA